MHGSPAVGAFRESKRSGYPVSVEFIIPAHNGRFWAIPVGRQDSIRIWSVDMLSLWGANTASVSGYVKQLDIHARGAVVRPSAHHAEGQVTLYRCGWNIGTPQVYSINFAFQCSLRSRVL